MRKLQIGIIGSMADIKLENSLRELAKGLGREIAKNHTILVFGFEGDFESLSSVAAQGAEEVGGLTLAFTWGLDKSKLKRFNSAHINTGQQRGGGREFPLILSCDAIISIGGGSGTLMEIAMAYQARIPIVVLEKSGGWSARLSESYLDERKALRIEKAESARAAVKKAIAMAKARASML